MRPGEVSTPDYSDHFFYDEALLSKVFQPWPYKSQIVEANTPQRLQGKSIAVARDDVCCFIYPANIDWLLQQGAEIHYFSLLKGDKVPGHSDALWLPGGYPELYAQQLAQSASLLSIREFIEAGYPVLAECGGAMLLGQNLISHDGCAWPMAQLLPFDSRMQNKLVSLGYRQEKSGVRGHEFHHSQREMLKTLPPAFACDRGDCGVQYKKLKASYIHWYFASQPDSVAQWFSL